MQEEITGEEGAEGDSGCGDPLTPEVTTASSSGHPGTMARVRKRIAHNKLFTAAVVLIIALIITIIILAVKKLSPPSPSFTSQNVSCTDSWITYKGKYFYISKKEKNWFMSLKTCSLLNASLAVIDTQQELDFWVHFLGPFDYWLGLSRETNKVWKWSNGTEFKNQFPIHGEGFCAYINAEGASSTQCSVEKGFLCSCNKVVAILDKTTSSKVGSS